MPGPITTSPRGLCFSIRPSVSASVCTLPISSLWFVRLHSRGGDRPRVIGQLDFGPPRPAYFAGPHRRQHQELERPLGGGRSLGGSHRREGVRRRAVGQRPHVLDDGLLPPERLPEGIGRRVVRPVAHGDRPLQHRADAMAHSLGGLHLHVLDGREDREHVGAGDLGDGPVADAREHDGPREGGVVAPPPLGRVGRAVSSGNTASHQLKSDLYTQDPCEYISYLSIVIYKDNVGDSALTIAPSRAHMTGATQGDRLSGASARAAP